MNRIINYLLSDNFESLFRFCLALFIGVVGGIYLARLLNFLAEFIAYLLTF